MSVCQVRNTKESKHVKRDTSSVKAGTGIPNALLPISLAVVIYLSVFLSLFKSFWKGLELDQLPCRLQICSISSDARQLRLFRSPSLGSWTLISPCINWWTISGFKRREESERESRIGSIFLVMVQLRSKQKNNSPRQ